MKVKVQYIKRQGYDGPATISRKFNGVQNCIRKDYKTFKYVNCSANSLNLAVFYDCGVQPVRNVAGIIEKVSEILNTPKRQNKFTKQVGNMKTKNIHNEKLKQVCNTKWIERHDSVEVFDQLLPVVHKCLEEIINWTDKETLTKAQLFF